MRQIYRTSLVVILLIFTINSAATAEGIPQFGEYRGYGAYDRSKPGWLLRSTRRAASEYYPATIRKCEIFLSHLSFKPPLDGSFADTHSLSLIR